MKNYLETFFLGILAALGSLVVVATFETLLTINTFPDANSTSVLFLPKFIILAVIIEEFFKFILLRKRMVIFSGRMSLLMGGVFLGLGFSAIEILFLLFRNVILVEIMSNIYNLAILHILTSAILGYFLSIFQKKLAILAILPPVALHLIFNLTSSKGISAVPALLISSLLFLLFILVKDVLLGRFAFGKIIFYNKDGKR
ncbi:MAG: hypothetical protein ACD_11C00146G0012 [uncultured bacterium]|nr:MAG: hypothetical protein ACD_11C00146G0012 [uncultured bacterium]HBR71179.1 hypothetical protein [Candidatus Moranbacteria bacterium]